MTTMRVGEQELRFERLARRASESVFELQLFVESESGDASVRSRELDVSGRSDVTASLVESALADWRSEHPDLRIERFVIRESDRCGVGWSIENSEAESERDGLRRGGGPDSPASSGPYGSGDVGFEDVAVERGEEVQFHLADPETSVYGTRTGTVTGVKTGTDGEHVLVVETDAGTNRIREDWIVDESDADEENGEVDG